LKTKDVLQVVVSDFHSGSNYALFLDRLWSGASNQNHTPRGGQIQIREQFEKFAEFVKQARKGKQVRLVHNGDAIDGDHHHSGDVCSLLENEQADIHVELMNEFQERISWQRGDEMYYTRGTQSHVHHHEEYIAEQMNAVPNGESRVFDLLKLETNGVLSWFAHHGPGRGKGANRGNSVRNWLKAIYYETLEDGERCPDIVYTGHVHDPDYSTYGARKRGDFDFFNMHGVILPSWQMKTAYAYKVAAVSKNRIGGVIHEIKSDGTVTVPKFSVMGTR